MRPAGSPPGRQRRQICGSFERLGKRTCLVHLRHFAIPEEHVGLAELNPQLLAKLMLEAVVWPFLSTNLKLSLMELLPSVIVEDAVP